MPPILANGYLFYAAYSSEATSALAYLNIEGIPGLVTLGLARLAKIFEAWVLVLLPFPGYFRVGPLAFLIPVITLYLIVWLEIALRILRLRRYQNSSYHLLILGGLMSLPFIFNSDVRILAPAIPFIYLGIFLLTDRCRAINTVLVLLIALNAGGSILNYGLSDSGVYSTTINVGNTNLVFPWNDGDASAQV